MLWIFDKFRILSRKKLFPEDAYPITVAKAISCPENLDKNSEPNYVRQGVKDYDSKLTIYIILPPSEGSI